MAVSTRSSRVVLIWSSEKCALRRERKYYPRELQIPNAYCAQSGFPRFCLSFPLLGNPRPPPGRQGCKWPHFFTLALHGITDDWGECCRLESTADGVGVESRPAQTPNCVFFCVKTTKAVPNGGTKPETESKIITPCNSVSVFGRREPNSGPKTNTGFYLVFGFRFRFSTNPTTNGYETETDPGAHRYFYF